MDPAHLAALLHLLVASPDVPCVQVPPIQVGENRYMMSIECKWLATKPDEGKGAAPDDGSPDDEQDSQPGPKHKQKL